MYLFTLELTAHERYVLISILEEMQMPDVRGIVENCGDYDIPHPERQLKSILAKLMKRELEVEFDPIYLGM